MSDDTEFADELIAHLEKQDKKRPFVCEVCGHTFANESGLRHHGCIRVKKPAKDGTLQQARPGEIVKKTKPGKLEKIVPSGEFLAGIMEQEVQPLEESRIPGTERGEAKIEEESALLAAIRRAMNVVEPVKTAEPVKPIEDADLVASEMWPRRLTDKLRGLMGKARELIERIPTVASKKGKKRPARLPGSTVEVEASLGTHEAGTFRPGVLSRPAYAHLYRTMVDSGAEHSVVDRYIELFDENVRHVITYGSHGEVAEDVYEVKERYREFAVDNEVYGVRVSLSTEKRTTTEPEGRATLARQYRRHSFKRDDGIIIDLSEVKEYTRKSMRMIYEVEIEVDVEQADMTIFIDAIDEVYTTLYSVPIPSPSGVGDAAYLSTLAMRKFGVSHFNRLLKAEPRGPAKPLDMVTMDTAFISRPVNLKPLDVLAPSFDVAATVKLDGERTFLLLLETGIFACNPPYDILRIGEGTAALKGTILDGEVIPITDPKEAETHSKRFFAFDVLVHYGRDVRDLPFMERLRILNDIDGNGLNMTFKYVTKPYFTEGTFYEMFEKAYRSMKGSPFPTDGIILQSKGKYRNTGTFKYKLPEDMTIDFYLTSYPDQAGLDLPSLGRGEYYLLCSAGRGGYIPFTRKGRPWIEHLGETMDGEPLEGRIVEMAYQKPHFVARRIRYAKDTANAWKTATSVWADIVAPFPLDAVMGKDMFLLRKYHNLEKKEAIMNFLRVGDSVMDIGSGRGGDFDKWAERELSRVYAVEPSADNVTEMLKRARNNNRVLVYDAETDFSESDPRPKISIINSGAEEEAVIETIGEAQVDAVVAFFSLTFFAKKKKLMDGLIHVVSTVLKPGGSFIGIVLDGVAVRELLATTRRRNKVPDDEVVTFENDVFSITQVTAFDDKPFGNGIRTDIKDATSMVHDVDEYLFMFANFEAMLKSKGIRLKMEKLLDSGLMYEKLPVSSQQFSALNRLFVFEKKTVAAVDTSVPGVKEPRVPKQAPYHEITLTGKYTLIPGTVDEKGTGLYVVRVKEDPSMFFRAILRALGKPDKTKDVTEYRKSLASSLTINTFWEIRKHTVALGTMHRLAYGASEDISAQLEAIDAEIAVLVAKPDEEAPKKKGKKGRKGSRAGTGKYARVSPRVKELKQARKALLASAEKTTVAAREVKAHMKKIRRRLGEISIEIAQLRGRDAEKEAIQAGNRLSQMRDQIDALALKMVDPSIPDAEKDSIEGEIDKLWVAIENLRKTKVELREAEAEIRERIAELTPMMKARISDAEKDDIEAEIDKLWATIEGKRKAERRIQELENERHDIIQAERNAIFERAYEEFKKAVADPNVWIDKSIALHVAAVERIDILILADDAARQVRVLTTFNDVPTARHPTRSIALYTPDDDMYYPIASGRPSGTQGDGLWKEKFMFDSALDTGFVRRLQQSTHNHKPKAKATATATEMVADDGDEIEAEDNIAFDE